MDYTKKDKRGTLELNQATARNLATGIGQSADAAMSTGGSRAQRVIDAAPAAQRKAACGYPEPTPDEFAVLSPIRGAVQTTLR